MKRDLPYFEEIWSGLWDEEIAHNVKVNEAGVFVDKMSESVEKMMIENLIKGYVPKKVVSKIPTLIFYAMGIPKLSNGYTKEQTASFGQDFRNVREPVLRSVISEFQARFPHAKIVEIPDGHHYCFIVQEKLVHNEMLKFLYGCSIVFSPRKP